MPRLEIGSTGSPNPGTAGDCQLKSKKAAMVAKVPARTCMENPATNTRCSNTSARRSSSLVDILPSFLDGNTMATRCPFRTKRTVSPERCA